MVDAFEAAAIGGRVVLVGIPDGNRYAPIPADQLRRKALQIKMSRRMGDVWPRAIKLVAEEQVEVRPLITHSFPLAAAADAFDAQSKYRGGCLKTTIHTVSALPW